VVAHTATTKVGLRSSILSPFLALCFDSDFHIFGKTNFPLHRAVSLWEAFHDTTTSDTRQATIDAKSRLLLGFLSCVSSVVGDTGPTAKVARGFPQNCFEAAL